MAKSKKTNRNNDDNDIIWNNLKGFCEIGASPNRPGNIPTGHFKLDFAIQYGKDVTKVDLNTIDGYDPSATLGIPLGKLVEIYGDEGSGKSSLAYRIAGYAQKLGHKVAWIDCEHSFQEKLATLNGCDVNKLIYSNMINHENPDEAFYAEDVTNNMIKLMKHKVGVIVLDSVANLVPKALFDADSQQQFMGLLPRFMSQNLGKLVAHAEQNETLLIFINQLREKIGQMFGDPKTSPGGHSLHHNASLRIEMMKKNAKAADIKILDPETGVEEVIGRHSNVRLKKNRFAQPFMETLDIPIYYQSYFPEIENIAFDTARQMKLISVRSGIFNWDGLKIEGKDNFINHIKNENLVSKLIESIKSKSEEEGVLLPPEIIQYQGE